MRRTRITLHPIGLVAFCSGRDRRDRIDESMQRRIVIVAALVASLATMACRDDSSTTRVADASATRAPRIGSCDRVPAMSVCSEYAGDHVAQNEAVLASACRKLSGTFASAACPNTAVLGSCVLSTSEVRKFYASGGAAYDAARARAECEGPYHGMWSAF